MIRLLTPLLVAFLLISCSSKQKPKEMKIGLSLTERAVNYELQGSQKMASYTYNRTIAKFRDMGRFCDMARVALMMYSVQPTEANQLKLEDAKAFAALGECSSESNIISFLEDRDYNYKDLEEPYLALAKFKRDNNVSAVVSIASSSSSSEAIRSSFYRIAAKALIEKQPSDATKYIEKAKLIDQKYAWTKNLLADEEILFQIYEQAGLNTDIISQRINILRQAIFEKNN